MITPARIYFQEETSNLKGLTSFLANQNITQVTVNSAVTEAIHAPCDQKKGMSIKFKTKLIAAPQTIAIVYFESFFNGSRYCIPQTLLKPIIKTSNENTIISDGTFSYPGPKNQGEKLKAIAAKPNIIGMPRKKTNFKAPDTFL